MLTGSTVVSQTDRPGRQTPPPHSIPKGGGVAFDGPILGYWEMYVMGG